MRFFGSAILAVATLASIVSGQANVPGTASATPTTSAAPTPAPENADALGDNPLSAPTAGDEFKAGKPVTIVWKPTTEGTISLRLRKGDSNNLETIQDITKDIPNSGTFTWTPSVKLEGDEDYAIEIVPASGEPNYSPKFALDSNGSGLSSSATPSTTLSTSTRTSTSATPTETDEDKDEDEDEDEDDDKTTTTKSQTSTRTTTSDASSKTDDADADEEVVEDDETVPNTNSATGISSSPLALVLCLAAAVAYLN